MDAGAALDASTDAARDVSGDAAGRDPELATTVRKAAEVRALIAGSPPPGVEPRTLFDISVDDDRAVGVETARLRILLEGERRGAGSASGRAPATTRPLRDAAVDRDAAGDAPREWLRARLDLDQARLAFYELPVSRRRELLADHSAARADAGAPSEAERRARDVEEQRDAALRAVQDARSEAERLVSTEYARLLDVQAAQAKHDAALGARREAIAARREATLGWQRRAREARATAPGSFDVDGTYDDLRRALRGARDALSNALDDLGADASDVPAPGPDALADLKIDVDTTAVRAARKRAEAEALRLSREEASLRKDAAAQLFDEIDTLNRERLAMLGSLSPAKRDAITGFTLAGFDQASSEVRQLTLILRSHRHFFTDWVLSLRHPDRVLGRALAGGILGIFEWVVAIALFLGWRRRAPLLLRGLEERARDEDRRARLSKPGVAVRVLTFLLQVHRPLEWLLLLFVLTWLLPPDVQSILEVRVLSAVVGWTFGASLIVHAIDALAGSAEEGTARSTIDTAALRLRSLQLVGRTVVAFGLILVTSAMVTGQGTIYQWVWSTCWFASIPTLLVLVRRWREVVFRRTERVRKKSRFEQWVLAHRHGWTSLIAATAGGVHLFVTGVHRATRSWVGRFDVTRRFLAYLFRRELSKLDATREGLATGPLPDAARVGLGPETASVEWVKTDADAPLDRLAARLRERSGGVIAIVGERGMGKTSALERLRATCDGTLLADVPANTLESLRQELMRHSVAVGVAPDASLDVLATALETSANAHGVLVDDVHRLVQPVVGGLSSFDALLAVARRRSTRTTWVLALDEVIWQFLARARGARPLFDEVISLRSWREEEIVHLLGARTAQVGLSPSFENLIERLPPNADDVDRQEALAERASDYYRLLWDYAAGNPSVALHMWRRSLGRSAEGETVVRIFSAMDISDFERLPDPTVFVLRAVLQMAPAQPSQIARATMVRPAEVADALRYASARGYVEEVDGGYRVTWTWFRPITRFLQRRHLLVAS